MILGYLRKSVRSRSGESITTQRTIICDYVKSHYPTEEIVFYEDEGFSGSTLNRPGFQKMMEVIKSSNINSVICYRLDRISRSVSDFSNTFLYFQENGIEFISVTEQLDTRTPIGRAMMYICSVFAQMELESTTERIRDSSLELAKSGKWAGGSPPLGYRLERSVFPDGKEHACLVIDSASRSFYMMLVENFLSGMSFSSMETFFKQNNIKTPTGKYIYASFIHTVITNPQCAAATPEIWDFFRSKGCTMSVPRESFDGSAGVIAYNRTTGSRTKKHSKNPIEKWVISIGSHEPLIDGNTYLAIQSRIGLNTISKKRVYDCGLLRGKLRCKCGSLMSAKRKIDYGSSKRPVYWYYCCIRKSNLGSKEANCDSKQISLSLIDNQIVDILKSIQHDPSAINNYVKHRPKVKDNRKSLESELRSCEKRVQNLITQLSENEGSVASKYIIANIEKIDHQILSIKSQLLEAEIAVASEKETAQDSKQIAFMISEKMVGFDEWSFDKQKIFVDEVIKECMWDGEELHVIIV